MLREDMAAAGFEERDDAGRFRNSYTSMLSRTGAAVKTVQDLARHSDPRLTLGIYSHTLTEDLGAAVDLLPDLKRRGGSANATAGGSRS